MVAKQTNKGFTIVELIVIVIIIGILAAVTIVAYNGVQDRAKNASLQSRIHQASSELSSKFLLAGNTYASPSDFSSVTGLTSDANTTYTYVVSSDQQNYCLSARNNKTGESFAASNKAIAPASGQCATNYVLNPNLETNLNNWGANAVNLTTQTDWAASGTRSMKATANTTATDSFIRYGSKTDLTGLTPGQTYSITATSHLETPALSGSLDTRARQIRIFAWNGNTATALGNSTAMPNTPGATATQSATFTIPAGSTGVEIRLYNGGSNSATNSIYWDGVIVTDGSRPMQFADGSTKGWFWDGDANASRSIGPAQPL